MSERVFDDLARRLAQPMPRRRALRLLGAAVAMAAVPALRPGLASGRSRQRQGCPNPSSLPCPAQHKCCVAGSDAWCCPDTHECQRGIARCLAPCPDGRRRCGTNIFCCEGGEACVGGKCVKTCPSGRARCGSRCCPKGHACVRGRC